MSHMGGFGRRRGLAVAAIALSLCVAVPELATGAGAATPAAGSTAAVRPASHVVLVRRHRTRAQLRRAHVLSYLRRHPHYLARKFKAHPGILVRRLRRKAGKTAPARRAHAPKKRKRRVYVTAKAKKKRAAAAKKKRRRRVAVGGAVAAKRKKKGTAKSAKSSGKPLGWKGWLEIALLVLAPFAAVALLLYITDMRRRPRAPSRSKRRRSLVITPLNKH